MKMNGAQILLASFEGSLRRVAATRFAELAGDDAGPRRNVAAS